MNKPELPGSKGKVSIDDDDPYGFKSISPSEVSAQYNFKYEPNQFDSELMNVMSMSPFDNTVSGSRKQMYGASHVPQALVVSKSTPRRIQTGAEQKYGKATFNVAVEQNCEILQRFSLYDRQLGEDAIKHSPETILIVENHGTHSDPNAREIHCITLPDYFSCHQYFGFAYERQEAAKNLRPGVMLKAGTVLLDSPNKHQDGNYCIGRELNTVFASFDAVAEDGVILSEEALPWLETRRFERRTISFGATHYPIGIYSKDGKYRGLPEIGDIIRPDGLLACLRSYDENFSLVEMSERSLRRVNYTHDKLIYVPSGYGRVIDVRVEHDRSSSVTSPVLCNEQMLRYDEARRTYYQQIWDYYNNVLRKRYAHSGGVPMSDEFNQLIEKAYSVVKERKDQQRRGTNEEKVQKIYRGSPSDDFTVEIVVEYVNRPKVGSKITDCWGG